MTEEEFWAILQAPVEIKPVFYRLYYNDDGTPICYSMEDLPGNYIDIEVETYHQTPSNVRVVDGKLKEIKIARLIKKLVPGNCGIACDPRDICVVTDSHLNTKWSIKTYETS
jgi:hypothetical protein